MSKIACIDAKIRANGCEENIDSKQAGLAAVTLAARGSPPATWGGGLFALSAAFHLLALLVGSTRYSGLLKCSPCRAREPPFCLLTC